MFGIAGLAPGGSRAAEFPSALSLLRSAPPRFTLPPDQPAPILVQNRPPPNLLKRRDPTPPTLRPTLASPNPEGDGEVIRCRATTRAGDLILKTDPFYREALDLMHKLSAADPFNTGWEIEVVSLLSLAGDAKRERASEAIAILRRLASQGRLGPEQRDWIAMLESIRGRPRLAGS